MAIFNDETKFTDKYFQNFDEKINAISETEVSEQYQELFNESPEDLMSIYSDEKVKEYGFTNKFDFVKHQFRMDFQSYLEVIVDRYQDYNTCKITADVSEVDNALQVVLKPLYIGDIFFYSRMLRKDKTIMFAANVDRNSTKEIVKQMENN